MPNKINTPSGCTFQTSGGKAQLKWNSDFASKRNGQFSKAQKFIDSSVLRYCSPLVPLQTGMLEKSGELGTELGSGEVKYIAPYAADQYYNKSYDHSSNDHPDGGPEWFERMKASKKEDILNGAQKIANGGSAPNT